MSKTAKYACAVLLIFDIQSNVRNERKESLDSERMQRTKNLKYRHRSNIKYCIM